MAPAQGQSFLYTPIRGAESHTAASLRCRSTGGQIPRWRQFRPDGRARPAPLAGVLSVDRGRGPEG